jgi:hypothetical protein
MSSHIVKCALTFILVIGPEAAFALEPCNQGVPGISLVEGSSNPPGILAPDTQSLGPNHSLKEQGWHNLRKAQRPLTIVCRYADRPETVTLPDTVDTCIFSPGHVTCQ